jgi:alkylated DNA nucleotide flippase Atl1
MSPSRRPSGGARPRTGPTGRGARQRTGAAVPAGPAPGELTDYAGRVLDVTEAIPRGLVMSYGDIAEYLGEGGPRQVGRVMALWGGGVAWWRVIHADGSLLAGHERAALARYREEDTPMRLDGDGKPSRVDMRRARWTPAP